MVSRTQLGVAVQIEDGCLFGGQPVIDIGQYTLGEILADVQQTHYQADQPSTSLRRGPGRRASELPAGAVEVYPGSLSPSALAARESRRVLQTGAWRRRRCQLTCANRSGRCRSADGHPTLSGGGR